MNKIDELIAKLCPEGVKYKELGDFINYQQPTKFIVKSTQYDDNNVTPVLTAGQSFILGYTNENEGIYSASKETPVIIFDDFTTSFHWVDFAFKVKSSAMKILTIKDDVEAHFRYLFYAMKCIGFKPQDHARHWISIYSKFQIPIPPLPVQEEIVRVLDKFTALEAELEAELEARTRQYEYYRNQLLSFEGKDVEWKTLGEVANYSKNRIAANKINLDSYVGVDNLLQNKKGKTFSSYVPTSGNLTKFTINDILIGNIRPYLKKIWKSNIIGGTNGDVLVIRINDEYKIQLNSDYLYYLLSSDSFFDYNMQYAKGAKMPRGDKKAILKYSIPVPSLEEQERIVAILDQFDALVNDISTGLPAEIQARRQQYEYYRGKLLTFEPVAEAQ